MRARIVFICRSGRKRFPTSLTVWFLPRVMKSTPNFNVPKSDVWLFFLRVESIGYFETSQILASFKVGSPQNPIIPVNHLDFPRFSTPPECHKRRVRSWHQSLNCQRTARWRRRLRGACGCSLSWNSGTIKADGGWFFPPHEWRNLCWHLFLRQSNYQHSLEFCSSGVWIASESALHPLWMIKTWRHPPTETKFL